MFNKKRLSLAKKRRRLTGKVLAERSGLSSVTISRLENGLHTPDEQTISSLSEALNYPVSFFFKDDPDEIETESVSFRSLSKMSAGERDAAVSAGILGLQLYDWVESKFDLPKTDLIDLSYESDPETAARSLRQYWNLGDKPIGNMLHLLESKGIRILSLSEKSKNVDAYSFWRDDKPYIFLNTLKTAERSIFDSGHELGHLILHRHSGPRKSRSAEMEANRFASAFLMPDHDIRDKLNRNVITISLILKAKFRWRVAAMALAYRLHHLKILSDWQYRTICIELGKIGYRVDEPHGIEREKSLIWQKVLKQLWSEKVTKSEIAKELGFPEDELENLVFRLTNSEDRPEIDPNKRTHLRIV